MNFEKARNFFDAIRSRLIALIAAALALSFALPAFGAQESPYATDVGKYGMTPITAEYVADGTYEISVDSNSPYFKVIAAELTVKDGEMSADITIGSHSYLHAYMGGRKEAPDHEDEWIDPTEDGDNYIFHLPVKALNTPVDCAVYSKRRKKWYSRKLLFDATSLPEGALLTELPDYDAIARGLELLESGETGTDAGQSEEAVADSASSPADAYTPVEAAEVPYEDGEYSIEVSMTGGTGRVTVSSPTLLIVKDGRAYAKVLWSSSYYDWMIVGGETYRNENTDGGNSYFIIPVPAMDSIVPVIADTTAMGDPVAIEYSLTFYADTIGNKGQIPQEAAKKVIIAAVAVIVLGGILNFIFKRKRKK